VDQSARRATIRDVARLAGVSPATVSQVLNGSRPVAAATRERTLEVISQLGYRPNIFGRGLRTRRSHLVGVVLPDLSNPFYPALVRGVQDRLGSKGYHAVIGNTDGDPMRERELLAELMDRGVDGLVHVSFTLRSTDFSAIASRGVPLVVIGMAAGFDHVHTNDFRAAFEMTTYLLDAGYSSVAHIAGPVGTGPSGPRLAGYRAAMGRLGLRGPKAPVVHGDFSMPGGEKAFVKLLESGLITRAIFCANDLMALGVIQAAQAYGLRVPEDVAVAGFDDIYVASLVRPALTTVGHPAGELGSVAAGLLFERIGGASGPPVEVEVGFELRKRQSA
jgi:DNA-binding LacI/PurR family transcriptional regulator